jgi:hypothetical protein
MPFKKVGRNKYRSPSGRTFTAAQVRLYHAHGGHFPRRKRERPWLPFVLLGIPLALLLVSTWWC